MLLARTLMPQASLQRCDVINAKTARIVGMPGQWLKSLFPEHISRAHDQKNASIQSHQMNCPECGNVRTKVVITRSILEGPYEVVRRYVCKNCGWRWYAAQGPEVLVYCVKYTDNGSMVDSVRPLELDKQITTNGKNHAA